MARIIREVHGFHILDRCEDRETAMQSSQASRAEFVYAQDTYFCEATEDHDNPTYFCEAHAPKGKE